MRKWLGRALVAVAVVYPVALLLAVVLLRFVGERWWATGVGLYLPQVGFLLPLPLVTFALVLAGHRRLLLMQLVAAMVGLFPLMGLVLPWPTFETNGQPTLRLLSFNVNSGYAGYARIADEILAQSPDVVLLSEVGDPAAIVQILRMHYPTVETSTQFVIATRFPLLSTTDPGKIPYYGRLRSPRFLLHMLDTPLGPVALFSVHPISPREGLFALRGQGLRKEISSGRLFGATNAADLQINSGLRALQMAAVGELAGAQTVPVLIAGDTNLPNGSPIFSRNFSRYLDGFREAGGGFGYTFPQGREWMRIDRILAGVEFRFVRFSVGCRLLSDHRCVVADLQRRIP